TTSRHQARTSPPPTPSARPVGPSPSTRNKRKTPAPPVRGPAPGSAKCSALVGGELGEQVLGGLHALAPDRPGDDLGGVDPVPVALGDVGALLEQPVGQRGGLQAQGQELVVLDDQ